MLEIWLYQSYVISQVDELVILLRNHKDVRVLKLMDTALNDVLLGLSDALKGQKHLQVGSVLVFITLSHFILLIITVSLFKAPSSNYFLNHTHHIRFAIVAT